MLRPLLIVAAVLLVLTLAVYAYLYLRNGDGLRSPDELAQAALGSGSDADKERAALDLARWGEKGREQMRRVLRETRSPDVKAAVVQGLGELRDPDSLPDLLKALEDPSEKVRGRAGIAVSQLLGEGPRFKANASPDERNRAIRAYQQEYEKFKARPPNEKS